MSWQNSRKLNGYCKVTVLFVIIFSRNCDLDICSGKTLATETSWVIMTGIYYSFYSYIGASRFFFSFVVKGETTNYVIGPLTFVDMFILWGLHGKWSCMQAFLHTSYKMVSSIALFYVSKVLSGLTLSFFATVWEIYLEIFLSQLRKKHVCVMT